MNFTFAQFLSLLVVLGGGLSACQPSLNTEPIPPDLASLKPVIENLGKQWSNGLQQRDRAVFAQLYDPQAVYLPDSDVTLRGNEAIADYWQASFPFLRDIQLSMDELEHHNGLLFETGKGIALIANDSGGNDTLAYKYLNIWKPQANGSYRVLVDVYNDRPAAADQ